MCLILVNYHPNLFHNDYLGASQQQEKVINREIQRARTSKVVLILFSPKKKTNKQKERWQGHRNSCGQLQRARILIKNNNKNKNIKKHSDTTKTTATYNKLLDETRDEHYYILNR